jgi:hypothetical protein
MGSALHTRTRRRAGKTIGAWLAFAMAAPAAPAADGPVYEVFAKALAPIASSVMGGATGQPGAMVVECSVTAASGKTAAARGAKLRLAVQAPDHLRIDLAHGGSLLTACRTGDRLWAAPAGTMESMARAAGLDTRRATPDTTPPPLLPLALDPQMLVFLPVVFDVEDLGPQDIDGMPHRGLRLGLMPEIKKSTKAADFEARAWINPAFEPRRVIVSGDDYSLEVDIESIKFAARLPESAWQPSDAEDVLPLPASALADLFEKMLGRKISLPTSLAGDLLVPPTP